MTEEALQSERFYKTNQISKKKKKEQRKEAAAPKLFAVFASAG